MAIHDSGSIGDECRAVLSANSYLSGKTLLKVIGQRISQTDTNKGFVIDGSLRTLEETEKFNSVLTHAHRKMPLKVFYLKIPKTVSFHRLVHGPNSRKRHDDTVTAVERRLSIFYYQLEERLSFIKKQSNWELIEIDATPNMDIVYSSVYSHLK